MSRCLSCNDPLSPMEMSRKSVNTSEEFQLCTGCLEKAGLLQSSFENPLAEEDVYLSISGLAHEEEF